MIYEKIANELDQFGGYLECQECGLKSPVGNTSDNMQSGWKQCCGYTMRWITKNEINKKQ